jgi:hypothetical protein
VVLEELAAALRFGDAVACDVRRRGEHAARLTVEVLRALRELDDSAEDEAPAPGDDELVACCRYCAPPEVSS